MDEMKLLSYFNGELSEEEVLLGPKLLKKTGSYLNKYIIQHLSGIALL